MFRCQLCQTVVPPRTAAQRVVTSTRTRKYPFRPRANRIVRLDDRRKRKVKYLDDPGGVGREVERELMVCPACASGRNGK